MDTTALIVAIVTLAGTLIAAALAFWVNRRTAQTGEGQLSLAGLQQQITNAETRADAAETRTRAAEARADADRARMDDLWKQVADLQEEQRADARRIEELEQLLRVSGLDVPPKQEGTR